MTKLTIIRVAGTDKGTFGVMLGNDGIPFTLTLERPWLDNKKGESCIPVGTYTCKRVNSPKFGNTFEVTNVPGRSAILFHKGNLRDDSRGCILVGESFENVKGEPGISASTQGYGQFMAALVGVDEFTLEVRNAV